MLAAGSGLHTDEECRLAGCGRFADVIKTRPGATQERELRISVRGSVYTLRRIKNDRCWLSRLSKIAHMRRLTADLAVTAFRRQTAEITTARIINPARAAAARNIHFHRAN